MHADTQLCYYLLCVLSLQGEEPIKDFMKEIGKSLKDDVKRKGKENKEAWKSAKHLAVIIKATHVCRRISIEPFHLKERVAGS